MACANHVYRYFPSIMLVSISLARCSGVLSARALITHSKGEGFIVIDVVFKIQPTWKASGSGSGAWVLMWENHMPWTQKSHRLHARW